MPDFFILPTLNTTVISKSCLSTLSIPFRIFVYIIGNTIKNEIKIDKFLELIHINAIIINDATGVAFIIAIGTDKISLHRELLADKTPMMTPTANAKKKPMEILIKENHMEFQKLPSIIILIRVLTTVVGAAISISLPIKLLAPCHSIIQNKIEKTLLQLLFILIFPKSQPPHCGLYSISP